MRVLMKLEHEKHEYTRHGPFVPCTVPAVALYRGSAISQSRIRVRMHMHIDRVCTNTRPNRQTSAHVYRRAPCKSVAALEFLQRASTHNQA